VSTGESLPTPAQTDRLVFFSDAVIAIAITLLVLDIQVPPVDHTSAQPTLVAALLDQWPTYLSYLISFLLIGLAWANHHHMFRYIMRTDRLLIWLNTLLLMFIALVPFSASLLSDYIGQPEEHVAAFVYGATLAIGGIFYNLVWRYASHRGRLLDPLTPPHVVKRLRRYYGVGPLLYGAAAVLALVDVAVSLGFYLLIPLLYVLPGPDERA